MTWEKEISELRKRKITGNFYKITLSDSEPRIIDNASCDKESATYYINEVLKINKNRQKEDVTNRSKFILGFGCILFVSILVIFLGYIFKGNSQLTISDLVSSLSSIVIVFLTFGLLIVTRQYVMITSEMLKEMKQTRTTQSEPQVSVYIWPWVSGREHPDQRDDYHSKVVIRNVGQVPIVDPALDSSDFPEPNCMSSGSGYSVLDNEDGGVINPGEEIAVHWSCSKERVENYFNCKNKHMPFAILTFKFRDSFAQYYSVTQDYDLLGDEKSFHLALQNEFTSSPSCYRFRMSEYETGIWVTA